MSKKAKVIERNRQLRAHDFPQRLNKKLDHRRETPTSGKDRGACVMCRTKYLKRVEEFESRLDDDSDSDDVIVRPNWDKDVKRAYKVCIACSTKHVKCFLCKNCHEEFHTAP